MRKKLIISISISVFVVSILMVFLFRLGVDFVFWTACNEQNTQLIKTTVALGANMEAQDMGRTPLMFAVEANEIKTAKTLLILGANPNTQSGEGVTPLRVAEGENFSEIAKLLREHGAKN